MMYASHGLTSPPQPLRPVLFRQPAEEVKGVTSLGYAWIFLFTPRGVHILDFERGRWVRFDHPGLPEMFQMAPLPMTLFWTPRSHRDVHIWTPSAPAGSPSPPRPWVHRLEAEGVWPVVWGPPFLWVLDIQAAGTRRFEIWDLRQRRLLERSPEWPSLPNTPSRFHTRKGLVLWLGQTGGHPALAMVRYPFQSPPVWLPLQPDTGWHQVGLHDRGDRAVVVAAENKRAHGVRFRLIALDHRRQILWAEEEVFVADIQHPVYPVVWMSDRALYFRALQPQRGLLLRSARGWRLWALDAPPARTEDGRHMAWLSAGKLTTASVDGNGTWQVRPVSVQGRPLGVAGTPDGRGFWLGTANALTLRDWNGRVVAECPLPTTPLDRFEVLPHPGKPDFVWVGGVAGGTRPEGFLHLFDLRRNRILWSCTLGPPMRFAVSPRGEFVFAPSQSYLWVLPVL